MGPDAWPGLLGTPATGLHPTAFPACTCLTTLSASTVNRVSQPREVPVIPDRWVVAVHEDYLVPFLAPVLANPVRVEHLHVRVFPRGPLFRNTADAFPGSETVYAHACRASGTDIPGPPATAAADTYTDDNDALFRLESKTSCPVDTCRVLHPHHASFTSPCLHPLPLEGTDHGFVRFLPRVTDVRVHRF